MAECTQCGKTILLGGIKETDKRFCSATCHQTFRVQESLAAYPTEAVEAAIHHIHEGVCPQCQGPGPIDAHTAHRVWSAVFLTRWSSQAILSCKKCGTKRQFQALFFSLGLGWWGFPHGLIRTPIQITKNLHGIYRKPALSPLGKRMMRGIIAQHWAQTPQA
jgi:hypothetical protein